MSGDIHIHNSDSANTAAQLAQLNVIVNSVHATDEMRSLALSLAYEYGKLDGRNLAVANIAKSLALKGVDV